MNTHKISGHRIYCPSVARKIANDHFNLNRSLSGTARIILSQSLAAGSKSVQTRAGMPYGEKTKEKTLGMGSSD